MQTKVYVDVLLVINYIINMLLIVCTAKLTGRRPKRRRIVAAALFGSASALTIFLPFLGFVVEFLIKLAVAAAIVLIAFPFVDWRLFCKQLFSFFAASFFFGGVMLGLWIAFSPYGMLYYNGVVYFDISSLTLIVSAVVAYGVLTLANRFARGGRVKTAIYDIAISYKGRSALMRGLVDTGNSLYEPFSDLPVIVCRLESVSSLLPVEVTAAIRRGEHLGVDFARYHFPVRLIPFDNVGGGGMLPAFRPDRVSLSGSDGSYQVENVYVALAVQNIGGTGYSALLNPDLIGIRI